MASLVGSDTAARPVTAAVDVKAPEVIGLCATCNNRPTCLLRAKRGKDALFCELFDDYVGPSDSDSAVATAGPHGEPSANSPDAKYKGLCVNCEHRETCTLPKPKSGVWHCEEYE